MVEVVILSNKISRVELITKVTNKVNNQITLISNIKSEEVFTKVLEENPKIIFVDSTFGFNTSLRMMNYIIENNLTFNNYVIYITETDNLDNITEIINYGYDDYMIGHHNHALLINRIRVGIKSLETRTKLLNQRKKYQDLSKELNENIEQLVNLSSRLIETRIPSSSGMTQRIAQRSVEVYKRLGETNQTKINSLNVAANFAQIGRLHLPDSLLKIPVMTEGRANDDLMFQVPVIGKGILEEFDKFKDSATIVASIWENFDGTGFPKKIQKWQIPIESRIIRVALDYQELRLFRDYSIQQSLETIQSRSNKLYDPKVVTEFLSLLHEQVASNDEISTSVMLPELKPGMKIINDINTGSGLKMLKAGTVLTEKNIDYLVKYSVSDPISEKIFIDMSFFQSNG